MTNKADTASWETATWEGSRRAQLRRALSLTVRERLQALDGLIELSERLATMPHAQRRDTECAPPARGSNKP